MRERGKFNNQGQPAVRPCVGRGNFPGAFSCVRFRKKFRWMLMARGRKWKKPARLTTGRLQGRVARDVGQWVRHQAGVPQYNGLEPVARCRGDATDPLLGLYFGPKMAHTQGSRRGAGWGTAFLDWMGFPLRWTRGRGCSWSFLSWGSLPVCRGRAGKAKLG